MAGRPLGRMTRMILPWPTGLPCNLISWASGPRRHCRLLGVGHSTGGWGGKGGQMACLSRLACMPLVTTPPRPTAALHYPCWLFNQSFYVWLRTLWLAVVGGGFFLKSGCCVFTTDYKAHLSASAYVAPVVTSLRVVYACIVGLSVPAAHTHTERWAAKAFICPGNKSCTPALLPLKWTVQASWLIGTFTLWTQLIVYAVAVVFICLVA